MDVASFASAVRFKFFAPDALPTREELVAMAAQGVPIDIPNTMLPVADAALTNELAALCSMPRMSTFAIGALINHAVRQMAPGTAFLNIGLWCGFTLLSGMIRNADKRCIGVDNFSEFSFDAARKQSQAPHAEAAPIAQRPALTGPGRELLIELATLLVTEVIGDRLDERTAARFPGLNGPREVFQALFDAVKSPQHTFHEMDYREYFARVHREPIGLYLYDAGHAYDDQLEGLRLAEPFFADGCIVLVDDTNAPAPRDATLHFVDHEARFEYRLLFDHRTVANGHPTWWNGLMAFQRVG